MLGYNLIAVMKTGGQGEVWRARDGSGKEFAVKVMTVAHGMSKDQSDRERKRFIREIDTQQTLHHPGIVEVLGSGVKDANPWYSMELADGSLRDLLLMNPGGMDEKHCIAIFTAILDAVVYAHRQKVIHRDLKPENVLMYAGSPRLADFGLVRRLHSGSSTITLASGLGSTKYAAPEQLDDAHIVDQRADFYSLGCILYEMLCGHPLYPYRRVQEALPRYRHIVHKATELDQAKRYASVLEMARAVKIASENIDRLRSPSSRAESLLTPINDGAGTAHDFEALSQLLIEHSDDSHLYLQMLAINGTFAMRRLASSNPSAFNFAMKSLDTHANGQFDWDYTDKLGTFLCAMFRATDDIEVRSAALRRVLTLALSHNRYRVRTLFIELATEAMIDETYAPIVADVIRNLPDSKEFLRGEMKIASLPAIVAEELAA